MSTVEFHPWNSRRAARRAARRVAHRPRPDARLPARPGAQGRPRRARGARRARRRRAGPRPRAGTASTSTSASSPTTASTTSAAPPSPSPGRSSAARPTDVTTTWWRKDRDPAALFVDYNQNARDHTMAAAYSVRGRPDATVSTPITWDEIDDVEAEDFTMPHRARPVRRARRPPRRHRRAPVVHRRAARVGRPRRAGRCRRPHP